MGTRVRVEAEPKGRAGRVRVRFDIRHLPGAREEVYRPEAVTSGPARGADRGEWEDVPSVTVELDSDTNDYATLAVTPTGEGEAGGDGATPSRA